MWSCVLKHPRDTITVPNQDLCRPIHYSIWLSYIGQQFKLQSNPKKYSLIGPTVPQLCSAGKCLICQQNIDIDNQATSGSSLFQEKHDYTITQPTPIFTAGTIKASPAILRTHTLPSGCHIVCRALPNPRTFFYGFMVQV